MSIRDICYHRVISQMVTATRQAVEATQSSEETGFLALVTDDKTLKVLSSCSKVYDALDAGVAVVELISKSRQALPDLDAIYFLTPTTESAELLVKDFKQGNKPQYRSAFIFWSSSVAVNPEVLKIIAGANGLLPRIRSIVDFNLHFVAYESRAFHLDMPYAIFRVFPGDNVSEKTACLKEVAVRLSSFCLTMGDKPSIRFHQTSRGLCAALATQMESYLNSINPENITRGNTELIIVDRSIDISGLLVHEYTYQALAYDVLHIACCTPTAVREKAGDEFPPDDTYQLLDSQEVQTILLGEQDELFVKHRHQHITAVSRKVAEELRHFSKDNAAAQYQAARAAGGVNTSERDIANAIRQLPQYKEMLQKFWAHLTLTDCCMKALKEQGIFQAGTLEQDLSTGVDKEGKLIVAEACLTSLGQLIKRNAVQDPEMARLLLLYLANMTGIPENKREKMIDLSGLSLDYKNAVYAFLSLGMHSTDTTIDGGATTGIDKHVHLLHGAEEKERLQFYKRKARDSEYETDRYEPMVKDVMERAAMGKLSRSKFPFVSEPDRPGRGGLQNEDRGRNGRVRATKFDWDWSAGGDGDKLEKGSEAGLATQMLSTKDGNRKRIVVFVIGGMTFSEIRSAYDTSRSSGADIYIGSTSIVTPPNLLDSLRKPKEELQGW